MNRDEGSAVGSASPDTPITAVAFKKKHKCNTWNEISAESQSMFVQKYLLVGGDSKAITESSAKHEVLGKYLNRLGRNKAKAVEILDTFCQGLSIHAVDELRHVLWNHNHPIVKRWIYDQVSQLFEQKLKEGEMIYNESSSLKDTLSLKELAMIKRRVRRHNGSSRRSCYNQVTALSSFIGSSNVPRASPSGPRVAAKPRVVNDGDEDYIPPPPLPPPTDDVVVVTAVGTEKEPPKEDEHESESANDGDTSTNTNTNTNTNTTIDICDEEDEESDSDDDDDENSSSDDDDVDVDDESGSEDSSCCSSCSEDESSCSTCDDSSSYEERPVKEDEKHREKAKEKNDDEGISHPKPMKTFSASELKVSDTPSTAPDQQQQQQNDQQPATRTRHGSISVRNPFSGLYNRHLRNQQQQPPLPQFQQTSPSQPQPPQPPPTGGSKRFIRERSVSTITPPTSCAASSVELEGPGIEGPGSPTLSASTGLSGGRKRSLTFKPTVHNFDPSWAPHSGGGGHQGHKHHKSEDKKSTLESPRRHLPGEETFITKIRTKYLAGSVNPYYLRPRLVSDEFLVKCDAEMVAGILRKEERPRWEDKEAVDYWSSRFAPRERWEPLSREATQRLCPSISAKALLAGWNIEFSRMSVTHEHPESEKPTIIDGVNDYPYYAEFLAKGPHDNYISKDGPCIVSVEAKPKAGTSCRAVVRTALHTERILLPPESPMKALRRLLPIVKDSTFVKAKEAGIINALVNYDEKQYTKCHKIGVLYCREGVKEENELFAAKEGSKAYNDFLNFIGVKISLKGWDKYDGGLDVEGKYNNYYNDWDIYFY